MDLFQLFVNDFSFGDHAMIRRLFKYAVVNGYDDALPILDRSINRFLALPSTPDSLANHSDPTTAVMCQSFTELYLEPCVSETPVPSRFVDSYRTL